MRYPNLTPPKTKESSISVFGGIDKNPVCPENCFSDTKNTSASLFPLLSARKKRFELTSLPSKPDALCTVNGITYVLGTKLYHNNVLQFDGLSSDTKKHIVPMGSKLIVFPDGYYINTLTRDPDGICTDRGSLTELFRSVGQTFVTIYSCAGDKPLPTVSSSAPPPTEFPIWLDDSVYPPILKEYSTEDECWKEIESTHTCIDVFGIGKNLTPGIMAEVRGITKELDGISTIAAVYDNAIVIDKVYDGFTLFEVGENETITVNAVIPNMDFICEHQNRLFGCRYGLNNRGEFVNEIYASRLGSPGEWYAYSGLSTDSYAASCGSEGEWTGICSHMGYVVFFKENRIHRLFGTKPANYTLYEDVYPGVKKGCSDSLALYNGTLYYHGVDGIYSYSGSTPSLISLPLGQLNTASASGAVSKGLYYLCIRTPGGTPTLFTYDTSRNIWHREDTSDFSCLSPIENNLLAVKKHYNNYYLTLLSEEDPPTLCLDLFADTIEKEADFGWYAESGNIGITDGSCRYLTKLKLTLEAAADSVIKLSYMLDSKGSWTECGSITAREPKLYPIYFMPPRCGHFKLKLEGRGSFKLYSLTKTYEEAGEVT